MNLLRLRILFASAMLLFAGAGFAQAPGGAPAGAAQGGRQGGQGGGQRGGGRGQFVPPGPPAPVPDAVKMERPTQAEVDKINADVKEWIAGNRSADKDLLKKFGSMLNVSVMRDNPLIRPTAGGVRAPRHPAFVETANSGDYDILFHGDSITDWWALESPQGGKSVFEKYFGGVKTANFAVAGDTTQGVLWGLQNGEGQGHKPKAVMLMIGTNSIGGASSAEVAEGIGADVAELRKDFPDAKILLLGIFPRGLPQDPIRGKIEATNKIISKLDDGKHVFYKDIGAKFLDADGKLIGFRGDNLHPMQPGYEIWAPLVADTLKGWAK